LEAARLELVKAFDLRPDDPRVKNLLDVVSAELGLPAGTVTSFAEEQSRLAAIQEERQRAEVLSLLDSGQQALAQQNYTRAVEDFRRALWNIDLARYVAWGDLEPRAKLALADAEKKRDDAERAERDEIRRRTATELRAQEEAREARIRAQVGGLLANATLAFERRNFQLAQDFAFKALEADPSNQVARELHNASIKAARESRSDEYYRAWAQRIRQMRETAEDLRIPQNEVLAVDAAIWARASNRVAPSSPKFIENPDDLALRKVLRETKLSGISFTEEDGTVDEVKTRIQAIAGVSMIITPEAREVIDSEAVKIVMDITAPMAVDSLLNQVTGRSAQLAWTVRDGVVQITTKAQAGGSNETVYMDVRDLIFAKTQFLPPRIRDIPTGDDSSDVPRTGGEGDEKTTFIELDKLASNLKEATDPTYWDTDGGGKIDQSESGYLIVTANPTMLGRVETILNDLRSFATTVVTVESKFLNVSQNFLQQIGVDFRGLGGSGAKGTVAQLDDVTNGLSNNASRGLDNSGTGDPAGKPFSGFFYNDGQDGDLRGRTENGFTSALGSSLTANGGMTAAIAFLNDLELQAILTAVEKKQDAQELNGQNLTVLNNERGYVSIINQTAYVRDFEVEVAQAAFIADPKIDVIQDGIVLDVKPTVSADRRRISLSMQPTVADLVRPIPTFSTSLAGTTQPVTLQLPQLVVRSFATTIDVPDGGSVLIGGLRQVLSRERRAEVPILGRIPLLSFFFKQEGVVDENSSLMVLVKATITDVRDVMNGR
jgi:type II secretory pathway component GspD/PulD (secretin)